MGPAVGQRISVGGGYQPEPEWLAGASEFSGQVVKWIPGQNDSPSCVVHLDKEITATGDVRGTRETRTGAYLVLCLRYVGQTWDEPTGTVHVELHETEPDEVPWQDQVPGTWVESHATYSVVQ